MARWFDHVLRYSRRDQLSANVALGVAGIPVNGVEIDNFSSPIHDWPVDVRRKIHLGKNNRRNAGPILAEVARLKREVAELTLQIEEAVAATTAAAELREELASTRAAAAREQARIEADWRGQLNGVLGSTSWKASAPIRWAGESVRRVRERRRTH
jgi:hypothetical protein